MIEGSGSGEYLGRTEYLELLELVDTGQYDLVLTEDLGRIIRRIHAHFFCEECVDKRNAVYSRTQNGGPDPCANRPKNRTRFPGQAIYCGICGRKFVFGGHGRTQYLMHSGAREHKCWNGATVNSELAARKIFEAAFAAIEQLPGFNPTFPAMVNEQDYRAAGDREHRVGDDRVREE